ncbi:MAG: hypothetical protein ACU837_04610 [Gammaproteobacteria bacterium]
MEISKFKILSDKNKDFAIPFKFNEASLMKWLDGLDKCAQYSSCQQILKALIALNAKEMEPQLRLTFLEDIEIVIVPIIKRLEQPILGAKIPLPSAEYANYELITATYDALAQGYWRIAEDIAAFPQQEAYLTVLSKALLNGLEALRKILLYTAEAYEQLGRGYWISCYTFYRRAENYDVIDLKIRDNPEGCNLIRASFNSLLSFYISGPNQYCLKDIKSLYRFCEQFAKYARIYRKIEEKNLKLFFSFSLNCDAPPTYANFLDTEDDGRRYLSTVKIAKIAYDNFKMETTPLTEFRALKPPQLVRVVKSLGMGTHRKFSRVTVKKNYSGIIGYAKILDYLRNLASDKGGAWRGVGPYDPRIAGKWKLPDLKLVPLDDKDDSGWNKLVDDSSEIFADAGNPWLAKEKAGGGYGSEQAGGFEIIDSSVKGYGILVKEPSVTAGVGDFIGIINEAEAKNRSKVEVGIIRRISRAGSMGISLGVELLSSEAEAVCIYRTGNVLTKNWALLLRGINAIQQPDSIIYNNHLFHVGEDVCLERGNKTGSCRINKVLHATSEIVHAELLVLR